MAGARTAQYDHKEIQHIIRLYNTNIDGTKKACYSLTKIRGIGKRFAKAVIVRAGVPINKRAGELSHDEIEKIQEVITNPAAFGIPSYMLNHQKDFVTGLDSHLVGAKLEVDYLMRVDRGRKSKEIRALRLDAHLKVRGQRTKSNGRKSNGKKTNKKK